MKTNIILLGGVPGTGKTTLAYQLALHFHIDKVISLDVLKETSKRFISTEALSLDLKNIVRLFKICLIFC